MNVCHKYVCYKSKYATETKAELNQDFRRSLLICKYKATIKNCETFPSGGKKQASCCPGVAFATPCHPMATGQILECVKNNQRLKGKKFRNIDAQRKIGYSYERVYYIFASAGIHHVYRYTVYTYAYIQACIRMRMDVGTGAGVISRGLRGAEPHLLKLLFILGLCPPRNSCIGLAFQSVLTLLLKFFALLWSIIHCYMVIETYLIFYYALLVLNKSRIISASIKVGA